MSSNLRTVAQIPARIKYLIAVAAGTSGEAAAPLDDDCFAFTCENGAFTASLVASDALPDVTEASYAAGDLFKDLGRQVVIYDPATNVHLAIFREVQEVNGEGDEGVPADYNVSFFVKVWSAAGTGVRVARTGAGAY